MRAKKADTLKRWASYASMAVALVLIVIRIAAWLVTDSLSLLTTVVDAVIDGVAALATGLGVHYAARPADMGHRYGHGKAEAIAALVQAMLLTGAASVLIFEGIIRLISPHPMFGLDLGLAIAVVSLVLTVLLVLGQGYVVKRIKSQAIAADRTHHVSDIFATLAVVVALGLARATGWPYVDPIFAIGIALFFGWSAWGIARDAMDTLLDRELSDATRQRIRDLVTSLPEIGGIHDLRTRSSGPHNFIEFHVELDAELSVRDAHAITDRVEAAVMSVFPHSDVIIHVEPVGIDDDRLDRRLV